jgi:hypothetical protein
MPRLFTATVITEVEFVSDTSDSATDQSYLRDLIKEIETAASQMSRRNIRAHRVTFSGGGVMEGSPQQERK